MYFIFYPLSLIKCIFKIVFKQVCGAATVVISLIHASQCATFSFTAVKWLQTMLLFPSAATACRIKLEDGEHTGASCVRDNSTAAEEQREGLHVFAAMQRLQIALFIDEIQMCGYNTEERESETDPFVSIYLMLGLILKRSTDYQ